MGVCKPMPLRVRGHPERLRVKLREARSVPAGVCPHLERRLQAARVIRGCGRDGAGVRARSPSRAPRRRVDVASSRVLREVSLDSVAVVAACLLHGLEALAHAQSPAGSGAVSCAPRGHSPDAQFETSRAWARKGYGRKCSGPIYSTEVSSPRARNHIKSRVREDRPGPAAKPRGRSRNKARWRRNPYSVRDCRGLRRRLASKQRFGRGMRRCPSKPGPDF